MASGDAQPIGFVVSVPGAEVAPFSSKAVAANLEKWDLTRSSVAFRYHAMRTHARTHARAAAWAACRWGCSDSVGCQADETVALRGTQGSLGAELHKLRN